MRYKISSLAKGIDELVDISEEEYQQSIFAKRQLLEALFLEEKMDLVAENYYELEKELLRIACRMVIFNEDLQLMDQFRIILNRRMMNFLSTGRTYIDHSAHHIHNLFENSEELRSKYDNEKEEIKKKYLGFRLMVEIRNYVQHRGYAVHSIKTERHVDENNNLLHRAIPCINIQELNDDKKFDKSIIKELIELHKEELIDIRQYLRQYFTAIGTLHEKTRQLLNPKIQLWENNVNNLFQFFHSNLPNEETITTLILIMQDDQGKFIDKQYINKRILDRRQYFELKNHLYGNFELSYSTNEI